LNSRSDVILPHKKFTWADFGGYKYRYPPPSLCPWSLTLTHIHITLSHVHITLSHIHAILHWLRVSERVNFKLALMAYHVLSGMVPSYLDQLVPVSSLTGRRRLRSSSTLQLLLPSYHQQSAIARFWSQPLCSGTLCQMTFSLHHQFLPSVDF